MNQSKALETIDSLKTRLSNLRGRSEDAGKALQRKAIMAGTGYVVGKMEADARTRSIEPFSILGLPTDLSVAAVGFAAETFAGGRVGEIGGAVADAALVLAARRMGAGG